MGLLKLFKETALERIQQGADEMRRMINDFNFEDAEREVRNTISEVVTKLRKHIQNLTDKYVIDVAYDRDTQILTSTIEDRVLTITVRLDSTTIKSTHTTRVTIPDDVDLTKMVQKYDAEQKKMFFIFKKLILTEENVENEEEQIFEVEIPQEEVTEQSIPVVEEEIIIPTAIVEDEIAETPQVADTTASTFTFANVEIQDDSEPVCYFDPVQEKLHSVEEVNGEVDMSEDIRARLLPIMDLDGQMLAWREDGWSYRKIGRVVGMSDKKVAKIINSLITEA